MKNSVVSIISLLVLSLTVNAQFNWRNIKTPNTGIISGSNGSNLSNEDIISGLKTALTQGANTSTSKASALNGFYKNPKIFIPFPQDAQKIELALRRIGLGSKIDSFTESLNRAAEEAAKDAAPIFLNAIKSMSFTDALSILKGNETAATAYLKNNTQNELIGKFKPVIDNALLKTNASKYWKDLITTYNKLPTVTTKVNPDLSAYTTGRAIDGMFLLVGEEEAKIRKDPMGQASDILQKVFGKK